VTHGRDTIVKGNIMQTTARSTQAWLAIAVTGILSVQPTRAHAEDHDDVSKVKEEITKLGDSLYLVQASGGFGGGNVAVSAGPDGVLLVDAQLKPMAPKLHAAVKSISTKPVRFIVNTHPHTDHVGGNADLGPSAFIIAHSKTRTALTAETPPPAAAALPRITLEDRLTVHLNGEDIEIVHPLVGHTDADVFVFFKKAKVVHLGDEFFAGMFPMIANTGDLTGLIKNLEKLVAELSPDYKIIPGHGKLATVEDLRATVTMLKETSAIVRAGIAGGKSLDQLKQDRVLAAYDSWSHGYLSADAFVGMLYKAVSAKPRT
jgi:glyoxylase-like metal-dependent hydrolase (beta-lactamase superfamily II)